jgi:cellulose synthase/poly-beta-1,6-N-acetylglucosamine synthase-like glycosyltransferase
MNNVAVLPAPSASAHQLLTQGWKIFFVLGLAAIGGLWASQNVDWDPWSQYLAAFTRWGNVHLPLVTADSPLQWVLMPAMLMLAFSGTLLLVFTKPPNWLRLPVGVGFCAMQVCYLTFRLFCTLSLDTVPNAIVSSLFFLSEVFIHVRIAFGNLSLLHLTDRSAQADESARVVQAGEYLPTVDVFVPTYSEPVEMLRRTIIGCQVMDYPRKTIWLLDDQRRPAMRQLAEELGCQYLDRPNNHHAKAGNMNHALEKSDGELLLSFDADFIPTRDFLQRTVGFFRDPELAMVQTPQNFFNDDAVTRNLGLEQVLEDEQRFFFRTLQPGRDAANAIVCHGSCFVVRRSALEAIGGIPTETITEDWATSVRLQAAGYKLYYLNEALSAGMSADKCGEFVQQRSRWAQGTLQALFASTNPAKIPGLNWKQRIIHTSAIFYYLGSLSSFFNLIAPLFFLFFGISILRMTLVEMLFYRLPLMVGYYLLFSWLTLRTRSAIWTEFYDAFLAPSMALTAVRSLCKPFGVGFRVTDKTTRKGGLKISRRVAMPFAVLLLLHVVGIVFAAALQRRIDDPNAFAIALYFALGNIMVLWLCLLVSVDVAQEHPYRRFAHRLPCLLLWEDTGIDGETISLSEGEIVCKLSGNDRAAKLPETGVVTLPSIGLAYLPALIRTNADSDLVTFKLMDLTLSQQRQLIAFLYCQPGQWDNGRRPRGEPRATWEYIRAGLRMYPLAESR